MPSPEQTYFNFTRLHVLFALSSVTLLGVTVWMLVVDHRREWKAYQTVFRDSVEPWMTETQIRRTKTEAYGRRRDELTAALDEARAVVPERKLVEQFCAEVEQDCRRHGTKPHAVTGVVAAYEQLTAGPSAPVRRRLLERMRDVATEARGRRQIARRQLRVARAEFDARRSHFEAGVRIELPPAKLDQLQADVDQGKEDVEQAAATADAVSGHVEALDKILAAIVRAEQQATENLADHQAAVDRLTQSLQRQRPNLAKRLLSLPIVDVFGRSLAIEQIRLPELKLDYHFRQVARMDRCMTCHQGIDKHAPAAPFRPAYLSEQTLTVSLVVGTADAQEMVGAGQPGAAAERQRTANRERTLEQRYGLALAPRGILDPQLPTVGLVLPRTPAADARLRAGDVILEIGGVPVHDRAAAVEHLLQVPPVPTGSAAGATADEVDESGRRLELKIRRGLPHPLSTHPRLDLFVGPLSPHPIDEFGCTICHDGQGSGTEFKWASHTPNDPTQRRKWRRHHGWLPNAHWNLPMLPRRFAQSRCLKCHHEVTDLEANQRFADPPAAKLLLGYELIRQNGCFGCHEIRGIDDLGRRVGPDMRLEPDQTLAASTKVPQTQDRAAGTMRKVGPTLRDMAGKVKPEFLRDWIRNPAHFLPSARMPSFYGMTEHLDRESLADSWRFETVEIHAVTEYLLAVSQPAQEPPPPAGVTEVPSADRGKQLFQTRGCLACHRHRDFPEGLSVTASDLSNVGSKYAEAGGPTWLAGWIRDPAGLSPRTLMPNTLLEPIALAEQAATDTSEGDGPHEPAGQKMTDPAADIAAYLAASTGWEPEVLPPLDASDLDELVLAHLRKTFPQHVADKYLKEGIPQSLADRVQGDELALVGEMDRRKKLLYVGARTIRKRGCYGCHDIPGFADAQLIGPALSDWGRKPESQLAFEQINQYPAVSQQRSSARTGENPGQAFFVDALRAHRREGFLWQKLRSPRSFDYKKARNSDYNEWLTMGRFNLTEQQIEAVITFVLGLTAQPPASQYVHRPPSRQKAIVEGHKVLAKYACAECHTLQMEQWQLELDPEQSEDPPELEDYEFLKPRYTAQELADSMAIDDRGRVHAQVVGMPRVDMQGALVEDEDDDGNPLYFFTLWEPALINGQVWTVGGPDVIVSETQRAALRPPRGGALARLLYPVVLAAARATGTSASEMEAWGWVPPPLVHEGQAVEPAWLYNYLLAPEVIRPATVLRMPVYNFSPAEAAVLVDYFAATSGAEFPYTLTPSRRAGLMDNERAERALHLLVDRKVYCAKCHLIGDFGPGGRIVTTFAPNLERVGRRLRPEYVHRWLANPKSLLPYTAMPVNFPPSGPPLGQDLYPGTSREQLEAVMELLLKYDSVMRDRTSIRDLVGANGAVNREATEEKKE